MLLASISGGDIHKTPNPIPQCLTADVPGSATTEADGLWDLSTLANMSYLRSIRADGGVDICGVNTPMMYLGCGRSLNPRP
jgi:hypothetical protein